MQKSNQREPRAPQQNLIHILHVDDSEHKYKLVEHIVPELVFNSLGFRHSQLAEDKPLDDESKHSQGTVRDVY